MARRNQPIDLKAVEAGQWAARQRARRHHALDLSQPIVSAASTMTETAVLRSFPGRLSRAIKFSNISLNLPRYKFKFAKPRLLVHPVSLGILAGVIAVFALALIIPHLGAKTAVIPKLAPPAVLAAQSPPTATLPNKPAPAVAARPTDRVSIPALGINAPVITVGLVKGALDTPKTLWQVARYQDSALAGSVGTAIIVGHSGAPGQLGVFEHLSKLQVGDTIIYKYIDGRSFSYQVLTSAAYPETTATAQLLFHQTANPTMNLISCYGTWNATTKDYDQRWIVTAQLVSG